MPETRTDFFRRWPLAARSSSCSRSVRKLFGWLMSRAGTQGRWPMNWTSRIAMRKKWSRTVHAICLRLPRIYTAGSSNSRMRQYPTKLHERRILPLLCRFGFRTTVSQEVLQGFDNLAVQRVARAALDRIPTLEEPLTRPVFDEAIRLFLAARRAGLTVRSGVDCLIAACAIRNDATLLHVDRDFEKLAQVSPLRTR
jgi:predicted nucleic acid-binding protein